MATEYEVRGWRYHQPYSTVISAESLEEALTYCWQMRERNYWRPMEIYDNRGKRLAGSKEIADAWEDADDD
jgi:hypothetical protein